MVEHDGNDGRKKLQTRAFAEAPFPFTEHVAEGAKHHEPFDSALMFEEQVEEGPSTCDIDAEEQVREAIGISDFYEGPRLQPQRAPVDQPSELCGQNRGELCAGMFGIGEDLFKESVVR